MTSEVDIRWRPGRSFTAREMLDMPEKMYECVQVSGQDLKFNFWNEVLKNGSLIFGVFCEEKTQDAVLC